ncbi:hypothetical protein As57867_014985, partial [Aphanomyces stellatus]
MVFAPSLLATLLVAASAIAQSVSQVHLGLTNAAINCPAGVSVNFASSSQAPITVSYTAPNGSTKTATTTASNYKVKSYTSPYLHTVNLCNLTPAAKYSYSAGDFSSSFVSPPGASADPTVIGIVGDADLEAGSFNQLLTPVQNLATQAVIVVGDYAYANGNHKIWDQWYNLQQPIFSKIPSLGINGNHEVIQSSAGYAAEQYTGYLRRAATPISKANADAQRTYYSINVGLVHLVFLDDYVGSSQSVGSSGWLSERQAMADWASQDLAQVNRQTTPYVVVVKHNPYYNTYNDHQCQCSNKVFVIDNKDACWKGTYALGTPKSEPQCGLQAKLEDIYAANKV